MTSLYGFDANAMAEQAVHPAGGWLQIALSLLFIVLLAYFFGIPAARWLAIRYGWWEP